MTQKKQVLCGLQVLFLLFNCQTPGDLNDDSNVFREVRKTMIKNFFSKEWIEHQKLVQAFEQEKEQNKSLQEAYDKLLEENRLLKSTDNKVTAEKNEKSEETN